MRIEADEYERMRSWLGHMAPKVFPSDLLNAETDPVAVLDRISAKSPAQARSGLGISIGDIVEFTSHWPREEVAKINDELSQQCLPTLSEVQARFSKIIQRVVRRGWIKDEVEFYAVRNAVTQSGAGKSGLWLLLAGYEAKQASKSPL